MNPHSTYANLSDEERAGLDAPDERADEAERQYVQLGALVIAAIAKHDMEHGESCDCYAAYLLEPLDKLLLEVAPR